MTSTAIVEIEQACAPTKSTHTTLPPYEPNVLVAPTHMSPASRQHDPVASQRHRPKPLLSAFESLTGNGSTDRPTPRSPPLQHIVDHVFIGSSKGAKDAALLNEHGITAIINTTSSVPNHFEGSPGFSYTRLPLEDSDRDPIYEAMGYAMDVLLDCARNRKNVLVHCRMGVSRSATIVARYIMHTRRCSARDALSSLASVRPEVCPNEWYRLNLMRIEREELGHRRHDETPVPFSLDLATPNAKHLTPEQSEQVEIDAAVPTPRIQFARESPCYLPFSSVKRKRTADVARSAFSAAKRLTFCDTDDANQSSL